MDEETAPWITIPETDITSVEHPCLVKNKLKAIDMLGGPTQIAQSLEDHAQQSLGLTFNPSDPASRTILSLHNETSNILLKVTVPKRTGRKRKRHSNEPYVEDRDANPTVVDATYLLQNLQDNPEQSDIEAVGNIKRCHLWRTIPDFSYFTKTSSFLRDVESHILTQQYPRLKQWSMPRTYGLENTEVVPPPVLSTQSLPYNYVYRQNPAVKTFADPTTGDKILLNSQAPLKLHIHTMMYEDPIYPTAPATSCPPLGDQPKSVQILVPQLQKLFEERPIWTRRAMVNSLPLDSPSHMVKFAAGYVCYSLRSGPWRDAYCKFGVDPRADPQYRKYQTILLQLVTKDRPAIKDKERISAQRLWARSPDTQSHIFTGTKAVLVDGKTWQLCDLHDPDLKGLVDVPELNVRAECEVRYFGWYPNGTIAKLRVLLKAKIDALAEGARLPSDMIEPFLQLPHNWVPKLRPVGSTEPMLGYLSERASPRELEWASAYRSICRTGNGEVPNYGSSGKGRLSKPKPKTRPSYIDQDANQNANQDNPDDNGEGAEEDAEAAQEYEEPEEGDEDATHEHPEEMMIDT